MAHADWLLRAPGKRVLPSQALRGQYPFFRSCKFCVENFCVDLNENIGMFRYDFMEHFKQ